MQSVIPMSLIHGSFNPFSRKRWSPSGNQSMAELSELEAFQSPFEEKVVFINISWSYEDPTTVVFQSPFEEKVVSIDPHNSHCESIGLVFQSPFEEKVVFIKVKAASVKAAKEPEFQSPFEEKMVFITLPLTAARKSFWKSFNPLSRKRWSSSYNTALYV